MKPAQPQQYSIGEAAKLIGISIETLRRYDRSGKIKVSRSPGGQRFFTPQDLELIRIFLEKRFQNVEVSLPPTINPAIKRSHFSNEINKFFIFTTIVLLFVSSYFFSQTPLPKQAVLGVQDFVAPISQEVSPLLSPLTRFVSNLGNSVRLGIGTFLLSLLPLDFQTKTQGEGSTTNTTIVQSGDIPSDLVLQSLTVEENAGISGNLLVSGTINTNTFTGSKLVFSGSSPSIYPSTTNTSISLNASGTGAINIGNSGTGDVYIAGGSGDSGCTITNSSGSLNCSSNITSAGDVIVNGGDLLTDLSTLRIGGASTTVNIAGILNVGTSTTTITGSSVTTGQISLTRVPSLSHTGAWAIGSSTWNVSDSSFYINPSSASSDTNLFGIAINGAVRFAVDAEGDIFGNNLVVAGNTTTATTTVAGDLTVEGNTTLGDSTTDTITLNPATITLAGGNKTLDLTGAATRTLTLLNSTSSQVADLDLSDGVLKLNGTTRISNAGGGTLDNLTVNPSSSSQVATTIKGATSQSVDLLQIKNSLDAVIAKVDQLGNITGNTLTSTVSTGTAPLTVASTTMVTNLNAQYLGGSTAADLGYSTNPNLVLNSDFSRRNKWMTFMPEVFSDTSGWTSNSSLSVNTNRMDIATAGRWATAGLSTWRDGRWSGMFRLTTATNKDWYVGKYVDANDGLTEGNYLVAAYQADTFKIIKMVNGTPDGGVSVATGAAVSGTINNYYWLELEVQGSTVIAKIYSAGVSPVAKSASTLLQTISGTVTDSELAAGKIGLWSNETAATFGGVSGGDGGVYVEGWGPESWGGASTLLSETFANTSAWTSVTGTLGTVASNILTAGSTSTWKVRAGLSTWSDVRYSAQFKVVADESATIGGVSKLVDSTNSVDADLVGGGTDIFRIVKYISGAQTTVASVAYNPKLNDWYWVELEAKGTAYVARLYSSGTSPVSKANATLVATLNGTVSDSAVVSGYVGLRADTTVASQWGGVSTGDGGVYVEGSSPVFLGTIGGQAIGFDESLDAGPLGKQWTMRYYIPATSRRIQLNQDGPDGGISPSTSYIFSGYEKNSSLGGSGVMTRLSFIEQNLAKDVQATTNLDDSAETSWTRKTSGAITTNSNTRRFKMRYDLNPSSTRTGTGFIMFPQVEQGSTVTPWRNAPADDDPIVWGLEWSKTSVDFTNTSHAEIDSRDLAINLFLPWDGEVQTRTQLVGQNLTSGTHGTMDMYYDGSLYSGGSSYGLMGFFFTAANDIFTYDVATVKALAAGKHRLAVSNRASAGTFRIYKTYEGNTASGVKNLIITATRGKFDLAEEYSVLDQTIEGGDVIRLSSLGGTTVEKVDKGYDQSILGIVSTDPGITLSSTVELNGYREKPNLRPVALQGRVPVKVTSENGVIKRGDILTSSASKPGYAMKATKAGRSIGIAMEDFAPQEQSTIYDLPLTSDESSTSSGQIVNSQPSIVTGKIMTFVNLSFYDPDVYLADNGQFVVEKQAQTTEFATLDSEGLVKSSTEEQQTPKYQLTNTKTLEVIERTGAFNDLFVANLKVGRLDASEITELIKLEQRIKNLELATTSAVLSASISGLLNDNEATNSGILNSLIVSGKTILSDLGVTGTITNGLLSIDGLNSSINSLGELKLQDQQIAGINILNGKVTIDKDGNVKTIGTLSVGKIQINQSGEDRKSAGFATIKAGETQVSVTSSSITPSSLIFATPDKPVAIGARKNGNTITITIKEALLEDLNVNWWVIN